MKKSEWTDVSAGSRLNTCTVTNRNYESERERKKERERETTNAMSAS